MANSCKKIILQLILVVLFGTSLEVKRLGYKAMKDAIDNNRISSSFNFQEVVDGKKITGFMDDITKKPITWWATL